MDDRQLIEDLLSALEYHTEQTRPIEFSKVAIEAAREYLRKPAQQEPVAWTLLLTGEHNGLVGEAGNKFVGAPEYYERVDVYKSPQPAQRTWIGLSDEEILQTLDLVAYDTQAFDFAYRIEAKLKEKNT